MKVEGCLRSVNDKMSEPQHLWLTDKTSHSRTALLGAWGSRTAFNSVDHEILLQTRKYISWDRDRQNFADGVPLMALHVLNI